MSKSQNQNASNLFDMSVLSSTNISLPTQTNISPSLMSGDFFSDIAKEEKKIGREREIFSGEGLH